MKKSERKQPSAVFVVDLKDFRNDKIKNNDKRGPHSTNTVNNNFEPLNRPNYTLRCHHLHTKFW